MRKEAVIDRFLAALSLLSDQELSELANLFTDEHGGVAVGKLIHTYLDTRIVARKFETRKSVRAPVERSGDNRSLSANRLIESADAGAVTGEQRKESVPVEQLAAVLADRDIFKSTREVVAAVNDLLPFEVSYQTYRKAGRDRLIAFVCRRMSELSQVEQRRVLRNFLAKLGSSDPQAEHYGELFRILARYE